MRLYLKYLNDFIQSFDFVKMHPDNSVIKGSYSAAAVNVLAEEGKAYAAYINGNSVKYLPLDLPEGQYAAEWYNPRNGKAAASQNITAAKGGVSLEVPLYEADIALRLKKC